MGRRLRERTWWRRAQLFGRGERPYRGDGAQTSAKSLVSLPGPQGLVSSRATQLSSLRFSAHPPTYPPLARPSPTARATYLPPPGVPTSRGLSAASREGAVRVEGTSGMAFLIRKFDQQQLILPKG